MSSAAPVFDLLPDVPAITLAAWRLQLTTMLLVVPGSYQLWSLTSGEAVRVLSRAAQETVAESSCACAQSSDGVSCSTCTSWRPPAWL